VELKSLGVVLADALHHELALRNSHTTCVAGFAVGSTAENFCAVISWQNPALELFPNKTPQRLFGRHEAPLADVEGLALCQRADRRNQRCRNVALAQKRIRSAAMHLLAYRVVQ